MSDPRTPYLDLYKPIVNDEAGEDLWGEKLNSNFDKLDFWAMNQGSIPDVPVDGVLYGRKDRQWSPAASQQEVDDLSDAVDLNTADINTIEADQITQNTAISTKAPLGPSDGAIYGWKDTSWFQVSGSGGMTITWDQITGKPPTYPPTLPIPESGVTGLPQKQAEQDAAIAAINWNSLSGKPATYPPTLPIPSSGVTGLDTKQASQDTAINTKIGDAPAGGPYARQTGAWVAVPPSGVPEAPTDGQLYSRKGSTASWVVASAGAVVSDTAPVGMPISTIWWNSAQGGLYIDYQDPNSRQWVMVNAPGMPEAPNDAYLYMRGQGGWKSTGTLSGPLTVGSTMTAQAYTCRAGEAAAAGANRFNFNWTAGRLDAWVDQTLVGTLAYTGDLGAYLLLSGGTVGWLVSNTNISATGYMSANQYVTVNNGHISAVNNSSSNYCVSGSGGAQTGGVLGYTAGNGYYGIVGYNSEGCSFYGAGRIKGSEECHIQGYVRSLGQTMIAVGHPLIASAANAYMNSGGTLQRSTSSTQFKTAIEPMQDDYGDKILALTPVFYRSQYTADPPDWSRFGFLAEQCHEVDFRFATTDRAVKRDKDGKTILGRKLTKIPNPEHIAWTAMDTQARSRTPMPEPEIDSLELSGEPEWDDEKGTEQTGVDLNGIIAALVNLVQRQQARIEALEAKVGV